MLLLVFWPQAAMHRRREPERLTVVTLVLLIAIIFIYQLLIRV